MRLAFLIGFLLSAFFANVDLASAQSAAPTTKPPSGTTVFVTKAWFIKPHQAQYKKGEVDVKSNKDQNAALTVDKTKIASNVNVQGKGDFSAKRDGNPEQVKVQNAKGNSASGDQSQKATGLRTGDAGKHHGELKQTKTGNDQNANLNLNTGQKMDTVMHGNKSSFDAGGNKGNKYNLTPESQSKTAGKGTITRNKDKYNYQENRAANGDSTVQLQGIAVGPAKKSYTCQVAKQGISSCVDENGLKAGEVVSQPDGTVIVKKTVAKGVDVPIGKSKVSKTADGKNVATVNDGLFQAQAGNYKQRDCMSDFGKGTSSKVKVEKPLTFNYNSQTVGDKKQFTWPDCINFGGKITLPAGMDSNRLAIQFDCSILPAGKLKCVDPGSCSKDCYYCNFCNNTRKVDALSNTQSPNVCTAKGGGTYQITLTACPPPAAFNKAMCSGFTKNDPSYFKKKGDIQCRILFYERPLNEAKIKQEFNDKLRTDTTGFVKKSWVLGYSIDNKNLINANSPTDFDLEEWYIHKNAGQDTLIGCVEGTSNYTLTGQKVKTDFLLEAGSLAAAPKSLFDTKPCPQVDAINQAQAQQDAADAAKMATTKAGFNWNNVFGRRR